MTAIKKAISLVVYQRKPGKETGRKSPSWVLTNFKACRRKLLLKNKKKNEKKNSYRTVYWTVDEPMSQDIFETNRTVGRKVSEANSWM